MRPVRRWRPRGSRARMPVIRTLARDVWQLNDDIEDYQLKAYRDHYRDSHRLILDDNIIIDSASDVVDLVAWLRVGAQSIKDIKLGLSGTRPSYLKSSFSDSSIVAAVKFAVRLWLFVPIDDQVSDEDLSLKQMIEQKLPHAPTTYRTSSLRSLAAGVCEKDLTRKAGIKLLWTSNLSEHLELIGRSKLKIFRHASVLSSYIGTDEE